MIRISNMRLWTGIAAGILLLTGVSTQAQAPADAYRNALEGISGTARAQAMSGAVGAMGADPTAILINPAGSAIYRRGLVSLGFQNGSGQSVTDWRYESDNTNLRNMYSLGMFNNITYIADPITFGGTAGSGWDFTWGVQYNKDYSYRREYTMQQILPPSYLGAYIANRANQGTATPKDLLVERNSNNVITYDPRLRPLDQIVVMGLNGEIIEGVDGENTIAFKPNTWVKNAAGEKVYLRPDATNLNVRERGGKSSVDFNVGFGYEGRYFFGASLRTTSVNYSRNSVYDEDYSYNPTKAKIAVAYNNELNTTGNIVALNLGAMMSLGEFGRIGVSYLLPQWGVFQENYYVSAAFQFQNPNAKKPEDRVQNYRFDTGEEYMVSSYNTLLPGKLTLSAMAFLSRYGMVTYDFQYRNLGSSRIITKEGVAKSGVNSFINEDLGAELGHRVGLEFRLLRMLSLRGGYSYTTSGLKAPELKNEAEGGMTYEYIPSGTIVDYVLPDNYQTYSAGFGIHLGRSVSLDFAWLHGVKSERVYAHPGLNEVKNNYGTFPAVRSVGAKMKNVEDRFVGTLTFAF